MDFENNEKKQEETAQDGAQREYRPGRSPRPRIHTAARPAYERTSYRNNNNDDEGGFRPEGFGAALQNNAPQRPQGGYRPRNNYNSEGGYGQRQGGYGQRPQGGYGRPQQGGYGQRPQQGGYGQRPQQ
ncbi:MAG: pseudouridine synthase, partial [Prevotella sp.]|nr:pseudouridine synthase [Prevotella sp.]